MKKIITLLSLITCLLSSCGKKEGPAFSVALDPQWSTLEVKGRQQNLMGFTTDVFKEMAKQQNVRFELVSRNWDNLTDGLLQKKYDAMLSTIYPYVFNLQKYDFSDLFLSTGPVLVVRVNSPFTSLDMFKGKEIGIQAGSPTSLLIEIDTSILPRTYESVPQALNAVLNGEIEGALVDVLIAQAYCNDLYKDRLKISTIPLNDQGMRLLTLHEKNGALIEYFNAGLKALEKSGKYQELQQKWALTTHCPQ
jgi:polar amino acid transport system substrate-binding protein